MVAGGRRRQSCAGEKGGSATGPSPVDRARKGSKHHLLVEGKGIPLAWTLTGGNRHDVTQLIALVDRVPPVRGKVGRPRQRPKRVSADRGYDYDSHRRQLRQRGIVPEIARRKTEHGSGLGRYRWVVERTFAWLHHSNDCSSATSGAATSTKHSSRSAAASSATADSRTRHCERSS